MPRFTQQHRVAVAGQTFLLDAAYEEVLLAVEMDGACRGTVLETSASGTSGATR